MGNFNLVRYMWFRKAHLKIRKISGTPPLTFKSNGKALKNYRIYGQTSRNLFDETNGVVTDTYIRDDGTTAIGVNGDIFICNRINVLPNTTYTFSWEKNVLGTYNNSAYIRVAQYDSNGNFLSRILVMTNNFPNNRCVVTVGNAVSLWDIRIDDASSTRGQHLEEVMLNSGSTPLPYEPYGESVGDRTGNLFDGSFIHRSVIEATVSDDAPNRRSIVIDISSYVDGNKITFSRETGVGDRFQMHQVNSPLKGGELFNSSVITGNSETLLATITLDNISEYPYLMIFLNSATQPITDEELLASKIMINVGNTPLPYEPYGYKVPVTVSNGTDALTTPIYLLEPLKMVGDEAEYIDYGEQKQHFADGTSVDVELPTLPTLSGTNTLSIGTEVKPSKIEITGRIKMSGGE